MASSRRTGTSPPKKRSGSASRSGGGSSKAAAKQGGRRGRAAADAGRRLGGAFAGRVGDRREDAWGLALVAAAVLVGIGLYGSTDAAFPAFLRALLTSLLGAPALLLPPLLAGLGIAVIMDAQGDRLGRAGVGGTLATVGGIGLWHLARGAPELSEGVSALHPAGGLLGYGVSRPLVVLLSTPGAVTVLVALALLGILVAVEVSLRDVLLRMREWAVQVPQAASRVRDADADPAADDDASSDTDDQPEPRSRRRSGRVSEDPDDDQSGPLGPRRRATVAAAGEQPPLPGTHEAVDDGLTDADRLAGRAPAPAAPRERGPRRATPLKPVESWEDYQLPSLDMLAEGREVGANAESHIAAQREALDETFAQFNIDARVARHSRGPTVTQFEVELGAGVQVKKVANLGDDIAYALAAPDVRIVAPIPGKSAIGVEVPNRSRDLITLGDILRSDVAVSDTHPLSVALGVDIAGNAAMVDLTRMPHLLVAGATGSGKSVTLNAMITSVVMRARPDQVRMILIDPKQVELNAYEGVPHLLTPVVSDPRKAADAVGWCVKEMELRYETLARLGYRNLDSYNAGVASGEVEEAVAKRYADPDAAQAEQQSYRHMPYVLLVIDELADLMMVAGRDVEDAICRIAQKARAVGIHMVIATQRPSVDVITGLIKANIPSRLALAVSSQTDSRTILDGGGAEKLVGHGDMLFLPASQGKPARLQGCFVDEREIEPVVAHCRAQREATFVEGVTQSAGSDDDANGMPHPDDDSDEALLVRAAEQVVTSGLGSVSMLQRKLRIGFARAGRLMDELEELGVVGENEGSKAREVHWTPEMLDEARSSGVL